MSIKVFDFFSGCGGTSFGLKQAGMDIVCAIDSDQSSIETFSENFPEAKVLQSDIENLGEDSINPYVDRRNGPILFCGCAPCQPFSKQNKGRGAEDPRGGLLLEFGRFVRHWKPEYILVENVPGIQKIKYGSPFSEFLGLLDSLGYFHKHEVLSSSTYGVPQKRDRLVLVASLLAPITLPPASHDGKKRRFSTVREWIGDLPELAAGEQCLEDPDHRSANLSELNLKRIGVTPVGGGRDSWPRDLWLECHKGHEGHTDVYGRLHWDKPASALTTRCISLSNGRFGHPSQNRAISVREAACLQTFPKFYRFSGTLASRARQIGNAVPPLMARQIGMHIFTHYESVKSDSVNPAETSSLKVVSR